MISLDDVEIYLPKYLSLESKNILYEELKRFPDNIDKRLYTDSLLDKDIVYQGDGLSDLLIINLPDETRKEGKGIIISNTCDIDPANKRFFPSRINYCPILNLEKYKNILLEEKALDASRIDDHINSIKKQYITQIFYLPANGKLESDSIVFFDNIVSFDNSQLDREELGVRRIFSLSNYGLYLFLFKLSMHFTRIQEGVDRGGFA